MLFIPTLNKKHFSEFVSPRYGGCPCPLPPCGTVSGGARYFGLRHVGLQDHNGDLLAAMLLFEYKYPGFPPFFLSCRGFVSGPDEAGAARCFTEHLRNFAREYGAMYILPAGENMPLSLMCSVVARPWWFFLYKKALPAAQRALILLKKLPGKRNQPVKQSLPPVSALRD